MLNSLCSLSNSALSQRERAGYIYVKLLIINNRYYNKKSLNYAKTLRSTQTECENILWNQLRAKRLNNIKFRRQVPIGKYIVDFVCLGKKLVIELDGSQHLDEKNIIYDKLRTEYLEKLGYRVLRFLDCEITNNLESVLNLILEEYNKII